MKLCEAFPGPTIPEAPGHFQAALGPLREGTWQSRRAAEECQSRRGLCPHLPHSPTPPVPSPRACSASTAHSQLWAGQESCCCLTDAHIQQNAPTLLCSSQQSCPQAQTTLPFSHHEAFCWVSVWFFWLLFWFV